MPVEAEIAMEAVVRAIGQVETDGGDRSLQAVRIHAIRQLLPTE